jgi:hypothetical protein
MKLMSDETIRHIAGIKKPPHMAVAKSGLPIHRTKNYFA